MTTLITGATGFVGQALCKSISGNIRVLVRSTDKASKLLPGVEIVEWDAKSKVSETTFRDVETVIHLLGEPVIGKRWNAQQKALLYSSRIVSTRALVESMAALSSKKPSAFICASAVGIYGDRGTEELDEGSAHGTDFLAKLCQDWEAEAGQANKVGIRSIQLRIGLILGPNGGMLSKLILPFSLGVGGNLGDGSAYFPWVHLDDIVGLIKFVIASESVAGPINAVAPANDTNSRFTATLGKALHRPTFFAVPRFALRLGFGEAAEVMLASQRIIPGRAAEAGYVYKFSKIDSAVQACLDPIPSIEFSKRNSC